MDYNKPEILSLDGNLGENFKLFKEDINIYFITNQACNKSNAVPLGTT